MEEVFRYQIPVWHPLVVHLPLALLGTAALASIIWSIRGSTFWRRCTLFVLSIGSVGALLAYFTGEALEEQVEGVPIVDALVGLHEQMALYTVISAFVALAALGSVSVWLERRTTLERDPKDPLAVRVVLTVLILVAGLLVAWTAHIGGTMVWGVPA